ncbi:MAG TPA: nitroreductase family protein [Desulfopila sp.]|nr:nitroreductase family protein [Desulfopila sp.]
MDFAELIHERRSVRAYRQKEVEQEKIAALIEAVRLSPSASNSQPWKLIIVDDPKTKDEVAWATFSRLVSFNKFVPQAPVLAVITVERPKIVTQIGGRLKDRQFPLIDIGIAASHLCLQATDLGLGTCMIGWFDETRIRNVLGIPHSVRLGLVVTIGYSAEKDIRRKVRKKKEAMSSFNSYR